MNIAKKVSFTIAVLIGLFIFSGLASYNKLNEIESKIRHITEIEEPTSAAAYEMEVNVVETGLAVLNYLDNSNPNYRKRVEEDSREFAQYYASYVELAETEREKHFGRQAASYFHEFKTLGDSIMHKKDYLDEQYSALYLRFVNFRHFIDKEVQPWINSKTYKSISPDGDSLNLSTNYLGMASAVLQFQLTRQDEYRKAAFYYVEKSRRSLAQLKARTQLPETKRQTEELERLLAEITSSIPNILAVDDELNENHSAFNTLRQNLDNLLDDSIQVLATNDLKKAKEDAHAIVKNAIILIASVASVFIIIVMVAFLWSKKSIIAPLKTLLIATNKMSKGDLRQTVHIKSGDELQQLGESFNQMAATLTHSVKNQALAEEALKDSLAEMDMRVKERTVELETSNENLIKEKKEREHLQAQLIQAQKIEAVGTLAGGVAHDFNNLLTAIVGNAELALIEHSDEKRAYNPITEIKKAANRAAELTRQLLAFSRKQLIQPKIVNLNVVVENIAKMLRRLIGENIELVKAVSPDLWEVKMDPSQIDQVIMNLVVNSKDAMPNGGKLTVETSNVELDEVYFSFHGVQKNKGPYVMLAISDTGCGMDKVTQSRMFEPFFTTKGPGRGTGLGLSTVYGIINQNDGLIYVYSEVGKGTTFKIYFPRADSKGKQEITEELGADLSGVKYRGLETVLMVEDDEMVRNITEKILKDCGYNVLVAEDGEAALKIVQAQKDRIQLVLTDVVMPKMGGKELADNLKSVLPQIPLIYMSGYTYNADIIGDLAGSEIHFIQKPFTPHVLSKKVREVLDRKQANALLIHDSTLIGNH